jgi:hypothetical protein
MRILYIDIDTLRPDHLGCYGYHRNTSPNIDRLAASGLRFTNVHASDTPCLPSHTPYRAAESYGESFADELRAGGTSTAGGLSHLVVSQGAWTCQRGVRFDDYFLLQTLHDGYHLYDDMMLFNIRNDPHETRNLLTTQPDVVVRGEQLLDSWYAEMMVNAARGRDPLLNVIAEGGPYHVRGQLKDYLLRLRSTGRQDFADALESKYESELSL